MLRNASGSCIFFFVDCELSSRKGCSKSLQLAHFARLAAQSAQHPRPQMHPIDAIQIQKRTKASSQIFLPQSSSLSNSRTCPYTHQARYRQDDCKEIIIKRLALDTISSGEAPDCCSL
mmetsp:Transcript_4139/g.7176  ORF Transcript_4139/g.7176 Transcript_4139/m.7176 type:complete len:118 (+) Transcript_4139:302-655(+)